MYQYETETNNDHFLTVEANKVSASYALELRTYCHIGAPSISSILFPWSLGLGKDKQFCERAAYLTLDRLLSGSELAISRRLLVLIIVQ